MLAGMTTYEAIVRYGWKRGSQRDWRCLLRPPWLELKASGGRCPAASSHYAPVQLSGRATRVGATGAPRAIQSLAALAEEANAAGVGTGVAGGIAVEEGAGSTEVASSTRLIGAGESTPLNRTPLNDISVIRQPTANTCVPSSLDMLLEEVAPGRAATNIESLRLAPTGMTPADMVGFVDDNLSALGMRTVRGDLAQALSSGQPFIAVVDAGHAVMVQGVREVNGVRQVVVRDPLQGAYMEPIAEFDARLVRDPQVLSHPIIWGER